MDPYYGELGDGPFTAWLLEPRVFSDVQKRKTDYKNDNFIITDTEDEDFDCLSAISTVDDMYKMGEVFFDFMKKPEVYQN